VCRYTSRSARMEVLGRSAQIAAAGVERAMGEAGLDDISMTVLDASENPGPPVAVAVAFVAAAAGCDPGQALAVTNWPVEVVVAGADQEQ
jgi:hypothetical protein